MPPLGFAWVGEGSAAVAPFRGKPLAKENVLGNEFFEATISRTTGGIQSIYSFRQRGNQLSQQVAFRLPDSPPEPGSNWHAPQKTNYSTMRAESVEVVAASPVFGEIVSHGALIDADGRRLAGFRQSNKLWAGSRVLVIDIELDQVEEPRAEPWNSYYAVRFAWPDESADLWRGVSLGRQRTDAARNWRHPSISKSKLPRAGFRS